MATRRSSRIKQKEEIKEEISTSKNPNLRTTLRQRSIFDIDDDSEEVRNSSVVESKLCLSESSDSDESDVPSKTNKPVPKDVLEEVDHEIKDHETIKTEDVKPNDAELYDFSSILQSQKEISSLAEKLTQPAPIKSTTVKPSTRNNRKRKPDTDIHEKDIETAGVEDLLKIGESKRISLESKKPDVKEESDDEEGNVDEELENNDNDENLENLEPIQVTIHDPNVFNQPRKKDCNRHETELKRQLNLIRKNHQLMLHKANIVSLIASGRFVNATLNTDTLLAVALSIIPSQKYYPPSKTTLSYVSSLLEWFSNKMNTSANNEKLTKSLLEELINDFEFGKARCNKNLVYLFIITARVLGLQCRLVMNLCTVPLKPPLDTITDSQKKSSKKNEESEVPKESKNIKVSSSKKNNSSSKRKVLSTSDDDEKEVKPKIKSSKKEKPSTSKKVSKEKSDKMKDLPTRRTSLRKKLKDDVKVEEESDEDEIFNKKKITARKVISDDDVKKISKKKTNDIWSEIYVEAEEKWISVDVVHNKVNCDFQIFERCTSPVSYILAWNSDGTIKDVTRRYVKQWHICLKSRVDPAWWNKTLKPWAPRKSKRNDLEDKELQKKVEEMPMPTSVAEFKNHPLYALKRHLLKFEAIYPPSAVPYGQIKGEDIYARACVAELHTKEGWMKQAKVIKAGEEPYKIVKARPKREKGTGRMIKDLPLPLFGRWQVENYVPPPAVDGKVPRNDFGNVELYKASMLPKGTVHLQLPGLMKVAKKLNIDCAPAVVGWEFSGGGSHPVFDGFIVCEEFKQQLLDAWNKEIENTEKKSIESREKRTLTNWNKFIRAIIVRNKLKGKYEFKFKDTSSKKCKKKK